MKDMIENEKVSEENQNNIVKNNAGVGVIEIILILVVLIALVLIFKDKLTEIVNSAMSALEKSIKEILA